MWLTNLFNWLTSIFTSTTQPRLTSVSNHRVKEKTVVDYLTKKLSGYSLVCNKTAGNSKLRPDICISLPSHTVIVEVDEHQHQNYESEQQRMRDIKAALKCKTVVFIRFNPDGYLDSQRVRHKSCWCTNSSTGAIEVSDTQQWQTRLKQLNKVVVAQLQAIPSKSLSTIYLFYDGYSSK